MLPKADKAGHYWFNGKPHGIAIFCSSKKPGKFFASAAGDIGILFNSPADAAELGWIRYFDTPEEALTALRMRGVLP